MKIKNNKIRWLDGEIYAHRKSIQWLNSIVRSRDSSPEDRKLVKIHIFDAILPDHFPERWAYVKDWWHQTPAGIQNVISLVNTQKASTKNLEKLYQHYICKGYEGLMIRLSNHAYAER